jgi:hypothetical protein
MTADETPGAEPAGLPLGARAWLEVDDIGPVSRFGTKKAALGRGANVVDPSTVRHRSRASVLTGKRRSISIR